MSRLIHLRKYGLIVSMLCILFIIFPATSFHTFYDNGLWWNKTVFYEIFVRSFYDSDGDGIGDLRGLIEKLDYLNDGNPETDSDLGITGIWLMPVSPSPSYHGYDVTDYRDINEEYGSLEDFKTLVQEAHRRGIKVIIDFVMNHSSSSHPWFISSASSKASSYRDWYIWVDQNPGYTGPWGEEVWHYRNGAYYYGIFWGGMPDLNYNNEAVKAEMFDTSKFWLEETQIDGFRLDAVKHLMEDGTIMEDASGTFTLLEDFRNYYKNVNPEAITVGEVWSPTSQVALYSDGTKVDFCFEFDLSSAILDGVYYENPKAITSKMEEVTSSYPPLQYAPFLTNHDMNRVFSFFSQNMPKMKLAAAIYLTLPGVPFIYYGEEIGMIGAGQDQNKRTPMQWNDQKNAGFTTGYPWYPVNSNYAQFNVEKMQSDENSLWHWYRKLIDIRAKYNALTLGDYVPMSSNQALALAYTRQTAEETIMVIHNFGDSDLVNPEITLAESYESQGKHYLADLFTGEVIGTVFIDEQGGFENLTLPIKLDPQGTGIVLIVDLELTISCNLATSF